MSAEPMLLMLVAAGVFRLIGAALGCLAARTRERARARTLVALLRLAGPGATLADHRAGGVSITVRTARAVAAGEAGGGRE